MLFNFLFLLGDQLKWIRNEFGTITISQFLCLGITWLLSWASWENIASSSSCSCRNILNPLYIVQRRHSCGWPWNWWDSHLSITQVFQLVSHVHKEFTDGEPAWEITVQLSSVSLSKESKLIKFGLFKCHIRISADVHSKQIQYRGKDRWRRFSWIVPQRPAVTWRLEPRQNVRQRWNVGEQCQNI